MYMQTCQTAQHLEILVQEGSMLKDSDKQAVSSSSEEEELEGPGKLNTKDGCKKATYIHRNVNGLYDTVRLRGTDKLLFNDITHLILDDFDDLHELCEAEIKKRI